MKLSDWAKSQGITYKTAWNWFKRNKLPVSSYQTDTGTIIVKEDKISNEENKVVIYGRVSNRDRKKSLDEQIKRCETYCYNKGYKVDKIFKEIASGMNDSRKELMRMINYNPSIIVIENKDRLTRFGFNYIEVLLNKLGCEIEVINCNDNDKDDLIQDMVSIITSFCCRLYGLRRGKNKSKKIEEEICNYDT